MKYGHSNSRIFSTIMTWNLSSPSLKKKQNLIMNYYQEIFARNIDPSKEICYPANSKTYHKSLYIQCFGNIIK